MDAAELAPEVVASASAFASWATPLEGIDEVVAMPGAEVGIIGGGENDPLLSNASPSDSEVMDDDDDEDDEEDDEDEDADDDED